MNIELKPCPFCGANPEARRGQINPKAWCRTEGCKGSQLPVTRLDDPGDIAAWNTRAALIQVHGEVCPTCGETEPYTGSCGTSNNDTKALCKKPAQATQAEVTDGIRPEDFTVDVVAKPMGGFAPVNTHGVRVTHKPTGVSVTCDAARSQHANRNQAFETLRTILALHPAQVAAPTSEIDIEDDDSLRFVQRVLESDAPKEDRQSARDMVVGLRKRVRKAHHGITAQAKKETP